MFLFKFFSHPFLWVLLFWFVSDPSSAPSNIMIDVKSSTSVHVTWRPLAKQDTNGPIVSYNILFRYLRRGMPKSMSRETSELNLAINNLVPYTIYNISIKAMNSAGFGPESDIESNRTKEDGLSFALLLFLSYWICFVFTRSQNKVAVPFLLCCCYKCITHRTLRQNSSSLRSS